MFRPMKPPERLVPQSHPASLPAPEPKPEHLPGPAQVLPPLNVAIVEDGRVVRLVSFPDPRNVFLSTFNGLEVHSLDGQRETAVAWPESADVLLTPAPAQGTAVEEGGLA